MKVTNVMKLIEIVNGIKSLMDAATEMRAAQCKQKLNHISVNRSSNPNEMIGEGSVF